MEEPPWKSQWYFGLTRGIISERSREHVCRYSPMNNLDVWRPAWRNWRRLSPTPRVKVHYPTSERPDETVDLQVVIAVDTEMSLTHLCRGLISSLEPRLTSSFPSRTTQGRKLHFVFNETIIKN